MLTDIGEDQQVQLPEGVELCSIIESGLWKFDCADQNQVTCFLLP